MRRAGTCALLLAAALSASCGGAKRQPDVLLVTVERACWKETSLEGGAVQLGSVAALAQGGVTFTNLVSPAPGGPPAMVSVLAGALPAVHGVRGLADGTLAAGVPLLSDTLAHEGYRTAAVLESDELGPAMHVARMFEVFDAPVSAVPAGHPGHVMRRDLTDVVASALQWVDTIPSEAPLFLWVHFAEPGPPELSDAARAARLGEWDRMVGTLGKHLETRGISRHRTPILALVPLAGCATDADAATADAYVLAEGAVRVRAFVAADGLRAGASCDAFGGLDEIAPLLHALAGGPPARLLAAASGHAEPRPGGEHVHAETLVPWSSVHAEPVAATVRPPGVAAPSGADVETAKALAADRGWPGSGRGPSARETLATFRAIDGGFRLLRQRNAAAAEEAFRGVAAADPPPPGALVGLGLAELAAGTPADALATFSRLENSAAPSHPAWRQALLGEAVAARAAARPDEARAALGRLLARSPKDVDALRQLAEILAAAGDTRGAGAQLLTLIETDPGDAQALAMLTTLFLQGGDPKSAVAVAERALARRPVNGPLLLLAARAHAAAGDSWTALDTLNRHAVVFGETFDTDLAIARIYAQAGRKKLLAVYRARAEKLAPDSPEARAALDALGT